MLDFIGFRPHEQTSARTELLRRLNAPVHRWTFEKAEHSVGSHELS